MGLSLIGRVAKPHGVRGHFGVIPELADAEQYLPLTHVFLGTGAADAVAYSVDGIRLHTTRRGTTLLVRAHGVASPEAASELRGLLAYADDREVRPAARKDSHPDLIGFVVETIEGEEVGNLKEIWPAPASNIYVVSRSEREDALIPAVPALIECVDLERERIVIRTIDGLLD